MMSLLLWTIVTIWMLMVAGAGYLAWRYYTKEAPTPEPAHETGERQPSDREKAPGRHGPPVVMPRPR